MCNEVHGKLLLKTQINTFLQVLLRPWSNTKLVLVLRNSGSIHHSGHFQAVEVLHVADGFGQDLSRLHGGHLSAGLGQVAELSQPRLQRRK